MRFFRKIYHTYRLLMKKSYSTLSGAVAFFLIINGGSILYLMITIGNIFKISFDINNELINNVVNAIISNATYSSSFFFFATSIYSASSLFFHLIKTGELIYEEINQRFNMLKRLIAIVFLCVFIFIIETFFMILFLSKSLFNTFIWNIFRYICFLCVSYLLSLCIIFFITPHRVRYHEIKRGAMLATSLWYLITILFTVFLNIVTNYKSIYGSLSFYVVFMIWVYLLSQGLVVGVVYNYYHHLKIDKLFFIESQTLEMVHQEEEHEKN